MQGSLRDHFGANPRTCYSGKIFLMKIDEEVQKFAKPLKLKTVNLIGGVIESS